MCEREREIESVRERDIARKRADSGGEERERTYNNILFFILRYR